VVDANCLQLSENDATGPDGFQMLNDQWMSKKAFGLCAYGNFRVEIRAARAGSL
jgi:formylmethanofuran dehydrogenase subunit E